MAKCKQNPLLEGGKEGANDIQNENVQGEEDYSSRNVYQSWYEVKRRADTREHVRRY